MSLSLFPLRKFYTEQIFVSVSMELRNHVGAQLVKHFKLCDIYTISTLECCSCAKMRCLCAKGLVVLRPVTSLGHQEGRRVFWEGPKFFELCPIILIIDVQYIFPRGAKNFLGEASTPLRPPPGYGSSGTAYLHSYAPQRKHRSLTWPGPHTAWHINEGRTLKGLVLILANKI